MQNSNPLSGHFRQPAIFLKLPSGGKYWPNGSIILPASGEVAVMPMTTKDEIMLRTPDALMNGQGVVSVIESCIPEIKNAWAAPTIDMDAILIAIRVATYGDTMQMDSKCTACEAENSHGIALTNMLLTLRSPDYNKFLVQDGLTFKFKPQNYYQSNKNNMNEFEEQKIIQLINNEDIDADTRKAQFDIHLQKIIDNNINILAQSTESITTESGDVVSEQEYIIDFYKNAPNPTIRAVQSKLKEISDEGSIKPARVVCEECNHEYNVSMVFDYANFFVPLS